MDEELEQEPHEPKLGFVEILLIFPFLILFDVLGMIIIFFGLDDFFIFDILNLLVNFYLAFRKVPATAYYICSLVEAIPYVGDLFPGFTIGFAMTIYFDRNPEQAKTIDKTVGKAAKLAQMRGVSGAGAQRVAARGQELSKDPAIAARQTQQAEKYASRSYSVASRGGGQESSPRETGPAFGQDEEDEEEGYREAA